MEANSLIALLSTRTNCWACRRYVFFLLAKDLKNLWFASRLEAGYLFHDDEDDTNVALDVDHHHSNGNGTNRFKKNGHFDTTNANW